MLWNRILNSIVECNFFNTIVFIHENINPPSAGLADEELDRFVPPEEADSMIEIAAGTAKEFGLNVGQAVRILLP